MEIIQTGGLRRIAYETTDDVEAAKIFTGIYGVGQWQNALPVFDKTGEF